jgi:L-aspartate oxidase
MWDLVGIVRSDQRLDAARRHLALLSEEIESDYDRLELAPDLIELRNIAQVGSLIVEAARRRQESRGLHETLDHPRARAAWAGQSVVLRRSARGPARARLAVLEGSAL